MLDWIFNCCFGVCILVLCTEVCGVDLVLFDLFVLWIPILYFGFVSWFCGLFKLLF